ncbi:hypothetical protein DSO57_1038131 [Entomophthora muscae]|nr:hypothetical protein DSO57_1038131 [Entomophthora muscae]
MSYGRPTPSGSAKLPANRFSKQSSSLGKPGLTNGHAGKKPNGKPNGFHPYSPEKSRRDTLSRLSKGYDLPISTLLPSDTDPVTESPSNPLTTGEFNFTPDYNYFRYFELEEHKGRGESLATSFSLPDFSSLRSTDLTKHTELVRAVAWNSTGQYFAAGSVDKVVTVWELDSMNTIKFHKELIAHSGSVDQLCWDPKNPNHLATASSDKTVRVWNAQTGELLRLISTPGENINICWSPDGKYLAVGNRTMTVSFIDVEKSQIVKEHSQSMPIFEIMWSHSGTFFLLSTAQGTVTILDFPSLTHVVTLPAHTASCYCLDIDPYGRYLATGGADGKVSIWCLKTLACLVTYNHIT